MSTKPFPFSYSRWRDYDICPRLFQHKYVLKDIEDKPSEAASRGNEIHAVYERWIRDLMLHPLPEELRSPELEQALALPGNTHAELRYALNRKRKSTGFFDKDVWVRAIFDVLKWAPSGQAIIVIDHKTGKRRDYTDQVRLFYGWVMLALNLPHEIAILPGIHWVDAGRKLQWFDPVRTSDFPWLDELWEERYNHTLAVVEMDHEAPAEPKYQAACRWCPVIGCSHHA